MRISTNYFLVFLVLVLLSFSFNVGAARLPAGFTELQLAHELNPTTMTLAPDGRLFLAMKDGRILVVRDDVLQEDPYLTVSVDNFNERGLSGIALHPDFEINQLIYVYYTVPGENHNRLSTFQGNGDFAIPGSENILLELDPLSGTIHNGGAMKFGSDGTLYLAVGDGAQGNTAQDMNSLLGKFLRLNDDGSIPEDNPFFNSASGDNRAIWALGFRNPFTFDIQPGTGRIFSNDVGGGDFEEVNEVLPGMNYGWPIIEGPRTTEIAPANYKDPFYAYSHDFGCSIIGAAFYNPTTATFPSIYQGKYFFADYCDGYMKVLDPDDGSIIETFATEINRPLAMVVTPEGDMYYLERAGLGGGSQQDNTSTDDGNLWKITYTGSGAPNVTRQPESLLVVVGEQAEFSVGVSGSEPFSYQWQKDGVNIAGAIGETYVITAALLVDDGAAFSCIVINSEGTDTSEAAILTVTTNTRPIPLISEPTAGQLYQGGGLITYSGSASDAEDGTLSNSQLTWWIDFHHDEHTHPGLAQISGQDQGTYAILRVGETSDNVWYRVYLQATDSEGLTQVVFQDVFPQKSQFTLNTVPPGLSINIDGKLTTTPATITGVVGITRTLEAPIAQQDVTTYYVFENWGDGSTAEFFTFDIPEEPLTLTANYQGTALGTGDGLLGRYWSDQDQTFEGAPTLQRIDPEIDFNWGNESPDDLISDDFFTARWSGFVRPLLTEDYTFYTISDDGVRLWVDNQLIIDQWVVQAPTEWSGTIALEAGVNYPILIEFFEQQGGAFMQLFWANPKTGRQLIPALQMLRPDLVLAIDDNLQDLNFKVFPVPADTELWVEYQTASFSRLSISIHNLLGQVVWHSEATPRQEFLQWRVDLENWPSGTYISRLVSKEGTAVRSFVKR